MNYFMWKVVVEYKSCRMKSLETNPVHAKPHSSHRESYQSLVGRDSEGPACEPTFNLKGRKYLLQRLL